MDFTTAADETPTRLGFIPSRLGFIGGSTEIRTLEDKCSLEGVICNRVGSSSVVGNPS